MTIYLERPTPICQNCNINVCAPKCKSTKGYTLYRKYCSTCYNGKYYKPWLLHRGNFCEKCGFIPDHICQLDVDHRDGNKNNNCEENLETLCANCHRLKTHLSKEYKNLKYR